MHRSICDNLSLVSAKCSFDLHTVANGTNAPSVLEHSLSLSATISALSTILSWVSFPFVWTFSLLSGAFFSLPEFSQILLVFTVVFFIMVRICRAIRTIYLLPEGPWGAPVLGMLNRLNSDFHTFMEKQQKIYGGIYSFQMGFQTNVVLSDPALIKEAFAKSDDFVAKPKSEILSMLGGYGVINASGDLWRSQRLFLIRQKLGMRHWGSNMEHVESSVQRECLGLIKTVLHKDYLAKSINPSPLINVQVANVICTMIMSTRFSLDDPKFTKFTDMFDEGMRLFGGTGPAIFLPFLRFLPGVNRAVKKLAGNREVMLEFAAEIIEDHKKKLDVSAPKDLVDAYLIRIMELREMDNEKELFHGKDVDIQLQQIVLDIFSAGVETLKTSLLWAILYMLHNKDVLDKVRKEMDKVVGHERLPKIDDFNNMPYTRSTLYEVMRIATVVPFGAAHATTREVKFAGYTLPKNTSVFPLISSVHMDEKYWDEPEQFKPERFLSEDGQSVVKPDTFMPFSVGKRACLGDQLAEKQFFLFFSTFFHCLDVTVPEGAPLPTLESAYSGVTVGPKPYEVVCTPRPEMGTTLTALLSLQEQDNASGLDDCRTYG